MTPAQRCLLNLLRRSPERLDHQLTRALDARTIDDELGSLSTAETAELFVAAALLVGTLPALTELHWLQTHGLEAQQPHFAAFVEISLGRESASLGFLSPLLKDATPAELRSLGQIAERIRVATVNLARALSVDDHRAFTRVAVQGVADLVRVESSLQDARRKMETTFETRLRQLGPGAGWPATRPSAHEMFLQNPLYRVFDCLDEIFGIDYAHDIERSVEGERLYPGGGRGVQTSYVTILIALEALRLRPGSSLIDLGSGYGRLGLMVGWLCPEVQFMGFEYVDARVRAAQTIAERGGFGERVRFYAQDLSSADFTLPDADVYYLYDPFSQSTYDLILSRLAALGRRRRITVVTKGDAENQLLSLGAGWTSPQKYDLATLSLFHSIPAATPG